MPFDATLYHGSPQQRLARALANPPARQFDNATSRLGAFFTPSQQDAQRYAGEKGAVYQGNLSLKNPYEMPYHEFMDLQDVTRGPRDADGFRGAQLPSEQWAARQQELNAQGQALREQLAAKGHDGVVVRNSAGVPQEVASFNDVPLMDPMARLAQVLVPPPQAVTNIDNGAMGTNTPVILPDDAFGPKAKPAPIE